MKLILQNQLVQWNQGSTNVVPKPVAKFLLSFALAGVVTGVNWCFQNFIADQDNQRQRQLIERVSNE